MMPQSMYEKELYHHGILGMSWGDRHGPPYPLQGDDKAASRADAKKKLARERNLEKARKAAAKKRKEAAKEVKRLEKAQTKQAKLERKAAEREAKDMALKKKLLDRGDINDIRRHAELFTNEELKYAIQRAELIGDRGDKKKEKEPEIPSKSKLERAADLMSKIATVATPIGTIVTTLSSIQKYKQTDLENTRAIKLKDLDIEIKKLEAEGKKIANRKADDQFIKAVSDKVRDDSLKKGDGLFTTTTTATDQKKTDTPKKSQSDAMYGAFSSSFDKKKTKSSKAKAAADTVFDAVFSSDKPTGSSSSAFSNYRASDYKPKSSSTWYTDLAGASSSTPVSSLLALPYFGDNSTRR